MTSIAVDAMGGDQAPRAEVEGAIAAARELGVRVILAGREEAVRKDSGHTTADQWLVLARAYLVTFDVARGRAQDLRAPARA